MRAFLGEFDRVSLGDVAAGVVVGAWDLGKGSAESGSTRSIAEGARGR